MDTDDVRRLLLRECEKAGSMSEWAKENYVSPGYVSDVVNGRRLPGGSILAALGLERVVTYRKVKSNA